MASSDDVAQVRAFNRFYTRIIGLLDEGMHKTMHSLAEARVIYELSQDGVTTASQIAASLNMDRGQLSRLMMRLVDQGLVVHLPRSGDGRANPIALTPEGRAVAARLSAMSDEMVSSALLDPVSPLERKDLVDAMRRIQAILAEPDDTPLVLRPPRVGDIGWLIHRQALLYNIEQGWNAEFEMLIARLYADFHDAPTAPGKALWVADIGGEIAGSVYVLPAAEADDTAQLRMLYVEPMFRGRGIGGTLVEAAVAFARNVGYRRIMLWTQDCLVSARRIYQGAGFELAKEEPHRSFGADLNGQYWVLEF